jgi:hypothetical protein
MRDIEYNFPIQKQEAGPLLRRAFEQMVHDYDIVSFIDDSAIVKEKEMRLAEAIHHAATTAASPAEKKLSAAYRTVLKQYNRLVDAYRVSDSVVDADLEERKISIGE